VQQVECALRTDSLRKIKELMKKNENLAEEKKWQPMPRRSQRPAFWRLLNLT
jgi:hypothetical protein